MIDYSDTFQDQVEWATQVLQTQLQQRAFAEAVYDLHRLFWEDVTVWTMLKKRLEEQGLAPQQLLVLGILFDVSKAPTTATVAEAYLREMPPYLERVQW